MSLGSLRWTWEYLATQPTCSLGRWWLVVACGPCSSATAGALLKSFWVWAPAVVILQSGDLKGPGGAWVLSLLCSVLAPEPTHSSKTRVAGSRARTTRPPPRRSTAPTTAPPDTRAPTPQQPRRPPGPAVLAVLAPGPPASGTLMTRRSLTPMVSSCRQQRSRR